MGIGSFPRAKSLCWYKFTQLIQLRGWTYGFLGTLVSQHAFADLGVALVHLYVMPSQGF